MIKSTICVTSSLSALAITGALAVIHVQPAAAQTASNVVCDGCVHSGDIRDGTIRTQDLAPSVLSGRTVLVPYAGSAVANCDELRNALAQIDDASFENP